MNLHISNKYIYGASFNNLFIYFFIAVVVVDLPFFSFGASK